MLETCTPRAVFYIFEELCALPHPSRNTKAATDYCVRFAKKHGLACRTDEAGNVVTAHSLNQVPLLHIANNPVQLADGGKLADLAPTLLDLMGLEIPEEMTGRSLVLK